MSRTFNELRDARKPNQADTRKAKQALYNTKAWKSYRARFRTEHPLCVECKKQGKTVPMWAVDHIVPHGGDLRLFWKQSNHQPLCKSCHRTKSQGEMNNG